MPAGHLDRSRLDKLFSGQLASADCRRAVRHLLSGCSSCREALRLAWGGWSGPSGGPDGGAAVSGAAESVYEESFRRVLGNLRHAAERAAKERSDALHLYASLRDRPLARQRLLVLNVGKLRTWGLVELLLEKSWEARFGSPGRAHELADIAVEVAERLDPQTYGAIPLSDLRGRAWAHLGNARRIRSDYRGAEEAFHRARACLAHGSGNAIERALLLEFEASLLSSRSRFDEAARRLDRAIAIYRRYGQEHAAGKALITRGLVALYGGDPETALVFLEEGIGRLDAERDQRLLLAARHNQIAALNDLGRYREALTMLMRSRPLYLEVRDRTSLMRLQWLEGLIAYGLGRLEQAEGALLEVRRRFTADGLLVDAALASLDLAVVYARQGRPQDIQDLAAETLAIFRSRKAHAEASGALELLRQMATAERLGLDFLREVGAYLQQAHRDSQLGFRH